MHISRKLSLLVFVVAVTLAVGTGTAAAKIIHHKEGSFNGAEAPGGPLGGILPGDAVDQANGDVYVLESNFFGLGQGFIDKFEETGKYAGVQITGAGTPQSSFAFGIGSGVAVDNSLGAHKGDVYVADTEHGVVDRFSSSGVFECQITGKTPVSAEEIAHECDGAAGSLTPDGSIAPAGLAVDASGDVYVADDAHTVIDKFGPSGEYVSQIKDPHLSTAMATLALDPKGDLYVASPPFFGGPGNVVKFDPAGSFVSVFDKEGVYGVGVDPKTEHVYISENKAETPTDIAEYEPSGALLGVFASSSSGGGGAVFPGLAVDGATGKIYAAEFVFGGVGSVTIVGPDIVVPTVTTSPATSVTEATATLNGHLDPDAAHGGGEVTECQFEYGATIFYGNTAPCVPAPNYVSPADVSANISGLTRSTTYHFRLKAANANGSSESEDATFTTPGPPVIDSEISRVNGRDVTLHAQVNPFGLDTTCQVQYVDDASFQSSKYAGATTLPCAPEDLGSGFGDQEASATVKGLAIGTTYHYRFLVTNQAGLSGHADETFATFGAHSVFFEIIDKEGHPFTQAGGHPYEVKTSFEINDNFFELAPGLNPAYYRPVGNLETVLAKLPPGLIGNPTVTPRCTRRELITFKCSGASQVGVFSYETISASSGFVEPAGIYNIVPPKGIAAEFGTHIGTNLNVYIDAKLNSGGDYRVIAESANTTALTAIQAVKLAFWGVPAEASHDAERKCPIPNSEEPGDYGPCSANQPVLRPFLRNPTSCSGPLSMTLGVDSWQNPGDFAETNLETPSITGCNLPPFGPSLEARSTSSVADSPSGLHFDLHVPQPEEVEGVGESDLKDATVTFPAGLTVNPSSADGLAACSEAQIGFTGFAELNKSSEPGVRTPQFTPVPAECPDASKLGSVVVDTPLVAHPLPGAIYLARQGENPFSSLLAVYITIYDPVTGVVVKLPGKVEANAVTGQLSTVVDQNPQVPFEDFKIDLFEGSRSPLTTPSTCGSFSATSVLAPWSGNGDKTPSGPPFEVTEAPGGGACARTVGEEPDAPSFSAGTFSPIAGSYSPFVLHLGREDGSQTLRALSMTLPEGLIGRLAGTSECPQADIQAAEHRGGLGEGHLEQASPSCPASSEIGVAHVGAGSGAPFYVTGHAYLAGSYQGAPFSIVVITPAVAGPFDLGTVVVRSALSIDPSTARVTVKTDPFPTILDGIPLDIRSIAVEVTRSQFTLNPTSCERMAVVGTLFAESSQAALSSPFQVGGCNNLTFKPSFTAGTKGQNSKAEGASLTVKVSQTTGEANIHKVELQLPVQLPSRLSTLQKACTAAVFEANPASCPAASDIGTGTAITPLLSVPITGPAYLVSHGGEAFPDVEFVLQAVEQGGDIKIVLDGKTQIKNGITYSHFETVPDAPISSFETVFPQGPDSIFGTNVPQSAGYSLCGQNLTIPTTLTGQNGVVLNQSTKLQVTGCKTVKKALTRAQKLKAALKACRKKYKKNKARREKCERTAHQRYGPPTHRQKKKKK